MARPSECSRRSSFRLVLVLLVTLISAATVASSARPDYECPRDCVCTHVERPAHSYEHMRCTNVDELRGKQLPVQSVDLSGLKLDRVPGYLEKLRNVTRLDLSDNQLYEVGRLGRRIKDLNLGHNRIGSGKLGKVPQFVQKLNLSHNEITVLPLEFMKLDKLRELELAGNPINCSCDTIRVRNWLQSRHVWTEQVIKCSLPLQYKGRPWLQVKQAEVCDAVELLEKNIWEGDGDNELMMGDAPAATGSGDGGAHGDAIEDDYMPYTQQFYDYEAEQEGGLDGSGDYGAVEEPEVARKTAFQTEVEGSGVQIGSRAEIESITDHVAGKDQEQEEEEEGSGAPIPIVPIFRTTDESSAHKTDLVEAPEDPEEQPVEEPEAEATPIPINGLGIFGSGDKGGDANTEAPANAAEETPLDNSRGSVGVDVAMPGTDLTRANLEESTGAEDPETADGHKLYILLAIILVMMVTLIVYVAIKQCRKRQNNNRRGQQDVEHAKQTELQDMNNRLVGKPLEKNGNSEHIPLMPNRENSDFAKPVKHNNNNNNNNNGDSLAFNPYQKPDSPTGVTPTREEATPLMNEANARPSSDLNTFKPDNQDDNKSSPKDGLCENGPAGDPNNNHNGNNNQFQPITNGYPQVNGVSPVPSPRSGGSPALPDVHHQQQSPSQKEDQWDQYTPKSPTLKRYSPVYSPETGRVKIKLSETPKPKTPLLVNRTRSNAGQYITTPNLSQRSPPAAAEES